MNVSYLVGRVHHLNGELDKIHHGQTEQLVQKEFDCSTKKMNKSDAFCVILYYIKSMILRQRVFIRHYVSGFREIFQETILRGPPMIIYLISGTRDIERCRRLGKGTFRATRHTLSRRFEYRLPSGYLHSINSYNIALYIFIEVLKDFSTQLYSRHKVKRQLMNVVEKYRNDEISHNRRITRQQIWRFWMECYSILYRIDCCELLMYNDCMRRVLMLRGVSHHIIDIIVRKLYK